MPVRSATTALLCLMAATTAGCGNDRTLPPAVATPGPALGATTQRYDDVGLDFLAPRGWGLRRGESPLVATLASGRATISIYRYPRTEPLPRTPGALDAAAEALSGASRQRDPSWVELKRSRLRVDGRPAVVLRGTGTLDGQPRTARSTHVYAFGGELVVDALAPAQDFKRVDAEAFRPLVRSLQLRRPRP